MTFKELSLKKKIEFIWDYYKVHILVMIIGAVFIISQVSNVINQTTPLMNVVMVNMYYTGYQTAESSFYAFLEQYGYDVNENIVDIRDQIYVSGEEENRYADIQSLQYLMTMLAAENPEIYFGPKYLLENYARQGCFVDLSTILPDDLMNTYQSRFVFAIADGQQVEAPYGICVDENKWFSKNQYYYEECCFGILATADNPAIAKEFAEYLLSFDSKLEGGK